MIELTTIGTPALWIGFTFFVLAMLVLVLVGTKMLLADLYPIPIVVSLGAVATLLGASALASLLWPPVVTQPVAAEEKAGGVPLRAIVALPDGTKSA